MPASTRARTTGGVRVAGPSVHTILARGFTGPESTKDGGRAGCRRARGAAGTIRRSVHPAQARLEVHVVAHPGEELLLVGERLARQHGPRVLPLRHHDRVLGPDLHAL